MMSMRVYLLGVELDDEGLADGDVDVLPQRKIADRDREAVSGGFDPGRNGPVDGVEVVTQDDHLAGLLPHLDHVALAHLEAGNGDPLAVDVDVPVADELTGLGTAGAPPGPEGDIVQALFEHAQEVLAGDPTLAGGLFVHVAELLL